MGDIPDCEFREKINFKKGFSGWDEKPKNIFCFCSRRDCNISKWFCVKCRSPKIPCPKCGTYTLQSIEVTQPFGQFKCYECNYRLGWSKISYLKLLAKRQKKKFVKLSRT